MLLAADAAPAAGPPWLAVVLAVVSLIGVVGVALAPALVEKVKLGKPKEQAKDEAKKAASAEPSALPTPTVVQRTDQALDLVGVAMADAHHERDEAQTDNRRLVKENTKLLRENGQLRALIYRLDPTWNGDSSGRSAG